MSRRPDHTQLEKEYARVKKLLAEPEGVRQGDAQGPWRRKLLSPECCRRAVAVLQNCYRASERFVCRVAGQHRSTQRHRGKVVDTEEAKLRHR